MATLFEADTQRRKRNLSMLKGVQDDDTLSPDDKVLFAETLREVSKSSDGSTYTAITSFPGCFREWPGNEAKTVIEDNVVLYVYRWRVRG